MKRWRTHSGRDIGGDSSGVGVYVDIVYIRPCPVRIPCNGAVKRVPGANVRTPADWQVRLFGTSGLIDRSSDHLSVWTIPLYGCMDRREMGKRFYVENVL